MTVRILQRNYVIVNVANKADTVKATSQSTAQFTCHFIYTVITLQRSFLRYNQMHKKHSISTINSKHISKRTHISQRLYTRKMKTENQQPQYSVMRHSRQKCRRVSDNVVVCWNVVWSSTKLNWAKPQPHRPYRCKHCNDIADCAMQTAMKKSQPKV